MKKIMFMATWLSVVLSSCNPLFDSTGRLMTKQYGEDPTVIKNLRIIKEDRRVCITYVGSNGVNEQWFDKQKNVNGVVTYTSVDNKTQMSVYYVKGAPHLINVPIEINEIGAPYPLKYCYFVITQSYMRGLSVFYYFHNTYHILPSDPNSESSMKLVLEKARAERDEKMKREREERERRDEERLKELRRLARQDSIELQRAMRRLNLF